MPADIKVGNVFICQAYGLMLETVSNQPPEVYTRLVEVPGRSGLVDLSEVAGLHYKNRQIVLKFHATEQATGAEHVLTKIKNMLHGHAYPFRLSWDYDFEYFGRFFCSIEQPAAVAHQVLTVSINAEPFKVKHNATATASLDGHLTNSVILMDNATPVPASIVVSGSPVWLWRGALYSGAVEWCRLYDVGSHVDTLAGGRYWLASPEDSGKTWTQTKTQQSIMDELFGDTWAELGTNRSIDPPEPILWFAFSHFDSGASVSITYDSKEL